MNALRKLAASLLDVAYHELAKLAGVIIAMAIPAWLLCSYGSLWFEDVSTSYWDWWHGLVAIYAVVRAVRVAWKVAA